MKFIYSFLLIITSTILSYSQINHGNVYIPNSCEGELVSKSISLSVYDYQSSKFCFKGSNIPGLKVYLNGIELDSTMKIELTQKRLDLIIEFEIPEKLADRKIYYAVEYEEGTNNSHIPINLATFAIHKNQTYIQTIDACSDRVLWALPFYATQTDIYLYDITNGQRKSISANTFYCCSGNIISMPKDTKGKFVAYVSGCYTSDKFTFEVNTLSKN